MSIILTGSSITTNTGIVDITDTTATPLTINRSGSDVNINLKFAGASITGYLGIDSTGTLKYHSTNADLATVGYKIWHAGNDGPGSTLDADTVDGIEASAFPQKSSNETITGTWTFSGATPGFYFDETDQVDKNWYIVADGGNLQFQKRNDAHGFLSTPFSVSSGDLVKANTLEITNAGSWAPNFKLTGTAPSLYLNQTDGGNAFIGMNGTSIYMLYDSDSNGVYDSTTPYPFQMDMSTKNLVIGANITAYSDKRLKDNIEVIPDALNKVMQLSGYTFNRIDMDTSRQTGVIAQEVLRVLPEAVIENDEGILHVAYGNMVGLLIEAIKEQQEQINDMKKEITILKGI